MNLPVQEVDGLLTEAEDVELYKNLKLVARAGSEMLEYAIENNLATPSTGSDLFN